MKRYRFWPNPKPPLRLFGAMMTGFNTPIACALFSLMLMVSQTHANTVRADEAQECGPVTVSIAPQKFFLDQISGSTLDVHVITGPGDNPEHLNPTPSAMRQIAGSELYLTIGVPFEQTWAKKLKHQFPRLTIRHTGTPDRAPKEAQLNKHNNHGHKEAHEKHHDEHHASHEHDHAQRHHHHEHTLPHTWTSPENAREIARLSYEAVVQHCPARSAQFKEGYQHLDQQLQALDQSITQRLASRQSDTFLVYHPAWDSFAERYGLTQLAIEHEGKDASARHLAQLIRQAKAKKIKTIFVQQAYNTSAATVVARQIQAQLVFADPLAEHYIEAIETFVDALAIALGSGKSPNPNE